MYLVILLQHNFFDKSRDVFVTRIVGGRIEFAVEEYFTCCSGQMIPSPHYLKYFVEILIIGVLTNIRKKGFL